ncbi:MAG: nuclear transport factor 2 family protein [Acidimicrobiia bacterium]
MTRSRGSVVVGVLVGGLVVASCTGSTDPATTSSAPEAGAAVAVTTTAPAAAATTSTLGGAIPGIESDEARIESLLAIFDAYNADDIDSIVALFRPGTDMWALGPAGGASTRRALTTLMVTSGDTVTVDECTATGEGTIVCDVTFEDDLHGAAGVTLRLVEEYHFSDDGQIVRVSMSEPDGNGYLAMEQALTSWLANEYPDEAARVRSLTFFSDERYTMLLNRVEEFVAQSTDYPP